MGGMVKPGLREMQCAKQIYLSALNILRLLCLRTIELLSLHVDYIR